MNPPERPEIKPGPSLVDFYPQDISQVQKAVHQLYEAAFTDGDAHRQAMQDAAWALGVITHVAHEVLYLRRENHQLETEIAGLQASIAHLRNKCGLPTQAPPAEEPGEEANPSVASSLRRSVAPSSFPDLVTIELERASQTFGRLYSPHEACAVIFEELCELWSEVMRRFRSGPAMLKELTQIAAMCQRTAVDLDLLPDQALRSAARERAEDAT